MQQPRHELAALIERVRELNDWSDNDIVRRATARGHKLSKSNISRIRNTDVVSLTASTIEGLAAGLGVPETEIARAALVSMGIDMPDLGGLDLETVIKMDTSISAHNRAMLLGLVRQMRRPTMEDEDGRTEEVAEPRTQARRPVDSGEARGDRRRTGASMKRTKVTRLNRPQTDVDFFSAEPHTSPHDAGRMPPPDQLTEEQILAARTTDDPSGIHHDTDK